MGAPSKVAFRFTSTAYRSCKDGRSRPPLGREAIPNTGICVDVPWPVGRLYLEERVTQIHITDIVLLPEMRGNGAGTAILEALIAFAHARGKAMGIFVEKFNPALRLYRRLGFVPIGDGEVYIEMDCPVQGGDSAVS